MQVYKKAAVKKSDFFEQIFIMAFIMKNGKHEQKRKKKFIKDKNLTT